MRSLSLPSLAALLVLAGCETPPRPDPASQPRSAEAAPQPAKADPGARPADAKKAYGEPISPSIELVALADLLKSPERYADKTIRTEGKVTAVCQSKGCWLEIGDDSSMAHIKLGNHRFFVPRSASGQHAVVQGRVFAQVDKGHCEQEAEAQTGKVAKVELDASGVELSQVR